VGGVYPLPRDGLTLSSSRSCHLFFYEGYIGVAPTVWNLIKALDRVGFSVTIFASRNPYPPPARGGENPGVIYFLKPSDVPVLSFLLRNLYRVGMETAVPAIELAVYAMRCAVRLLRRRKRTGDLEISVGIDTNGSVAALLQRILTGRRYAYLSLELPSRLGYGFLAWWIPPIARAAFRKAECVIVQDRDRYEILCDTLRYRHPVVFFLPNAPTGSGALSGEAREEGNFLRSRLGLGEKDYPLILLHAGMIHDAVMSKELARTFKSIEGGYALVFHERMKREAGDPYIRELRKINGRNLFLSLDPLPIEEVDRLYASATIGLAFYKDLDSNFSLMSMASGKLGYYLKHGKPVLVNDLPSLSTFVESREIGVVVRDPCDPAQMRRAVESILANYARFSANARKCFLEELDFDRNVIPVTTFLGQVAERSRP